MLSDNKIKAFVPTTQPEKAKQFYLNILGLKLISEDDYALEFEGQGALLRIITVDKFEPHPFTILGWDVSDLAILIKSLNQLGVEFEKYNSFNQDNLGIWISPNKVKIAWFKDPDGNILSLTEMPK
jgi:catechol 2,3-dioxygenase-like lactoylglutathione lyase family enzyme